MTYAASGQVANGEWQDGARCKVRAVRDELVWSRLNLQRNSALRLSAASNIWMADLAFPIRHVRGSHFPHGHI
jgi:hypothetical protein